MTHEEFLLSLSSRFFRAMHGTSDGQGASLAASNPNQVGLPYEAIARWLAWHVALYFQGCSRVDFETCRAWQYWDRDTKEDVDWTVNTGYCLTHRNHPERTRLKTTVLRTGSDTRYTCEIYDFATRTIEQTDGNLTERGTLIISDVLQPRRLHMGRIVWTRLAVAPQPQHSLAQSTDLPENQELNYGDPPPVRPSGVSPHVTAQTTRQSQGSALAAVVQHGAQRANSASLSHRVQQELNRLAPEVYRRGPRSGEGVLAVVESNTQTHGEMQGEAFSTCYMHGVFSTPDQGIQNFRRSNTLGPLGGGQMNREFYWGVLQAQ